MAVDTEYWVGCNLSLLKYRWYARMTMPDELRTFLQSNGADMVGFAACNLFMVINHYIV